MQKYSPAFDDIIMMTTREHIANQSEWIHNTGLKVKKKILSICYAFYLFIYLFVQQKTGGRPTTHPLHQKNSFHSLTYAVLYSNVCNFQQILQEIHIRTLCLGYQRSFLKKLIVNEIVCAKCQPTQHANYIYIFPNKLTALTFSTY